MRQLKTGEPIDYLSMLVQTDDDYSLHISTDMYNQKILETFDMEECNPASTPITKELLEACKEGWVMDLRDRKKCQVLKVLTISPQIGQSVVSRHSGRVGACPLPSCTPIGGSVPSSASSRNCSASVQRKGQLKVRVAVTINMEKVTCKKKHVFRTVFVNG